MGLALIAFLLASTLLGQEPGPPGNTKDDQERNAALLSGYDSSKYPVAITGYSGQDLQKIGLIQWRHAVRTRIGGIGNYKAGLTWLPNRKTHRCSLS